jgi:hypothetical protein
MGEKAVLTTEAPRHGDSGAELSRGKSQIPRKGEAQLSVAAGVQTPGVGFWTAEALARAVCSALFNVFIT